MSVTISQALQQARQQLSCSGENSALEAELLLGFVLEKPRSYLFTWPEQTLTPQQTQHYTQLITKRKTGQPIAYLTQQRAFWTLDLHVSPDTLIPRPETELLVEQALVRIPAKTTIQVLDLGTGTGAIALAIASERPLAQITAVDISPAALTIAKRNAADHQLTNITFHASDWFASLPHKQTYTVIVSNPPYIAAQDPHLLTGDVRFEPQNALVSGADGLDAVRHIITQAPHYLAADGYLLLEHGYDQGKRVTALLQQSGFHHVACLPDLAGLDRVSLGQVDCRHFVRSPR